MVEKKLKFLRIYLILTLVFGVIGLSDSILSLLKISSLTYSIILGTLAFVFFFFNIFALVHIMQEKLEKITWVNNNTFYNLRNYLKLSWTTKSNSHLFTNNYWTLIFNLRNWV